MGEMRFSALVRLLIYIAGIVFVSLGIVLCKKCGFGISPISSIPFVLEAAIPLTFGTLTMLFHLANTILQMMMAREITVKYLLQVPVAILFGQVIDLLQFFIVPDTSAFLSAVLYLVGSIIFTAIGMVLMINMHLVQNPPDGFVYLLSLRTGHGLGRDKVLYDSACVVISIAIGLMLYGNLYGMGAATILSAIFVGRLIRPLNPVFLRLMQRWAVDETTGSAVELKEETEPAAE